MCESALKVRKQKICGNAPYTRVLPIQTLDVSQPDLPTNTPIQQQHRRTGVPFIVSLSKADVFGEDDERYIM
jgi:hypothetical protein